MNATVDRVVRERRAAPPLLQDRPPAPPDHPISTTAFLWGGAAPDIPLIAMTVGAATWFTVVRGWELGDALQHVFRDLYFSDPWWKAINNLLQSPVMLAGWLGLALLLRRYRPAAGRVLLWFFAGVALHVAADVPLHHDDGPLLLFPFDWDYRFSSPVSYWDPDHHGDVVGMIELGAVVLMALYLLRYHLRGWWRRLR